MSWEKYLKRANGKVCFSMKNGNLELLLEEKEWSQSYRLYEESGGIVPVVLTTGVVHVYSFEDVRELLVFSRFGREVQKPDVDEFGIRERGYIIFPNTIIYFASRNYYVRNRYRVAPGLDVYLDFVQVFPEVRL